MTDCLSGTQYPSGVAQCSGVMSSRALLHTSQGNTKQQSDLDNQLLHIVLARTSWVRCCVQSCASKLSSTTHSPLGTLHCWHVLPLHCSPPPPLLLYSTIPPFSLQPSFLLSSSPSLNLYSSYLQVFIRRAV